MTTNKSNRRNIMGIYDTERDEYGTFIINRDCEVPVRFTGRWVASVSDCMGRYDVYMLSGDRYLYTHIDPVYNTRAEYKMGNGNVDDYRRAWVCDTDAELRDLLGQGPAAKRIMRALSIDNAIDLPRDWHGELIGDLDA